MDSRRKKTLLILVATILLPILIYVVYEISAVQENEEVIEEIYRDQLESILFSVNQYSADVMTSLISKIEQDLGANPDAFSADLQTLMIQNGFSAAARVSLQNPSIELLYNETGDQGLEALIASQNFGLVASTETQVNEEAQKKVKQLIGYYEAGYRKLEPFDMIQIEERSYQLILAIMTIKDQNYLFMGFIDPLWFVTEIMSPKMQQAGDEKMVIALTRKGEEGIVFATDSLSNDIFVTREMWLFPELLVGVSPLNETVSQLVKQRSQYNLIAIGMLVLLLAIGFILIVRNLTREMQLAQTKSDFVSNVSHELRTPLSLISMFAETLMLGRVPNEKKKQEYFEIIYKETNRLTNIVNRILNFSRIEANKRTYVFEEVELNELMDEIVRDYSFHLELNGFQYELDINGSPLLVDADREAIYEAVVNLIDNAMKYSNDTKHLTIRLKKRELHGIVEIQDQGVGISEEKQKHIFEKFYRVTEGDVYTKQGAGLGLTILKHIMDAHQAKVEVESKLNEGSTFRLIFNLN